MQKYPITVNPIRIHTPIHNEMLIKSPSINQLENTSKVPAGAKIVTLDDEFSVEVILNGDSYYYSSIERNLEKYVKKVEIYCGICGGDWFTVTAASGYKHNCKVPYNKADDTVYPMKTRVTAVNSGPTGTANNTKNIPDSIYILEQTGSIYVVGKIYDLEVRATDDPGWKTGFTPDSAQKLSTLSIGEKGDNKLTAYKYGIKLGYRAYFDLKTLGRVTDDVRLVPKIYYVNPDGSIDNTVKLFYRNGPTSYKELKIKDFDIAMNMINTKGEAYNGDYQEERNRMIGYDTTIDYRKNLHIMKPYGILLDKENSVATRYKGAYVYPINNSRRWFGEIYVPSSTIVAESGATISDIANGKKIKNNGYLLITFEDIYSTLADESKYLKYSMARDTDGVVLGYEKSVMAIEKDSKNSIILPNGATCGGYLKTDAPIIIYDVSQRANNDYESSGTH